MSRYENEDGVVTEASDGVVAYLAQVTPDQEREVGVGPWQGPWPEGDHWDHELLEHGDRRNVVDPYRYWKWQAIKADMAARAHGLHIAIENVSHDLNIGSIVRTANAFNVGGVHVVGKRRWNRRGAMVTDRYLRVYHHPTPEHLVRWAQENNLELLAIPALLEHCKRQLRIGQYGSTRSINVSAAAAIAMHTWIMQHGQSAPF